MLRKLPSIILAGSLALTACTPAESVPDSISVPGAETTTAPAPDPITTTTSTTAARDCGPIEAELPNLQESDLAAASLAVSRAWHACADEVVVAPSDGRLVALAAQLAAARDAVLLISDDPADLNGEFERLQPVRITTVGFSAEFPVVAAVESLSGTTIEIADSIRRRIGATTRVGVNGAELEVAAEVLRTLPGGRVVISPDIRPSACDEWPTADAIETASAAITGGTVWLVENCSPRLAMLLAASTGGRGSVLIADRSAPWSSGQLVDALRSLPDTPEVRLVGDFGPDAGWQLETMLSDAELPGGGLVLFPGRRIVSLYGNPSTRFLGVLGEQGAEEAAERARRVAEPYGADGVEVLPGFEIIATVASVGAGGDGNYSSEMAIDTLRPWVELAGRQGIYVTLDLQPGRTDFLTQAKIYEELLLLPHVGLALDPEWRLKPNQVHLAQIGSVDAAEVNQVAEWLAQLVRDNRLPQKLFIVHQFKLTMITNRASIVRPVELAVMIHADGQGPIATKYATYAALTAPEDADQWWWGWKNFYDEDSPTPTPEQVLELDPLPVYVSYQ